MFKFVFTFCANALQSFALVPLCSCASFLPKPKVLDKLRFWINFVFLITSYFFLQAIQSLQSLYKACTCKNRVFARFGSQTPYKALLCKACKRLRREVLPPYKALLCKACKPLVCTKLSKNKVFGSTGKKEALVYLMSFLFDLLLYFYICTKITDYKL